RDWVLLKLQPSKYNSLRNTRVQKMAHKYYGPVKIIDKIRAVAYRLDLPIGFEIHPTFHVSQLKNYHGSLVTASDLAPAKNMELELEPQAILDRKMVKRGNRVKTMVFILWQNLSPMDATWEFLSDLRLQFPNHSLWTRNL